MALADFNGWHNLFWTILFAIFGSLCMYRARPSVQQPTSWTKAFKGVGIFWLVLAGINFLLVVMHAGAAYYTENVPAKMDAVIPVGTITVRNGNEYYNAQQNFPPTRANALRAEAAPGPTRANALRAEAARIPETPI